MFFLDFLALFVSLSSEIHKSIISGPEIILSWKIKAKATWENSSCNWCNFLLCIIIFFLFSYIAHWFIFSLSFYFYFQAVTNYKYDEDPLLVSCGISIEKQLTRVDGRVLDPPKVVLLVFYWLIMLPVTTLTLISFACSWRLEIMKSFYPEMVGGTSITRYIIFGHYLITWLMHGKALME